MEKAIKDAIFNLKGMQSDCTSHGCAAPDWIFAAILALEEKQSRKGKDDPVLDLKVANETAVMFSSLEEARCDKVTFVRNIGWLLSQTREKVERCYLDEDDQVHIEFRGGHEQVINVRCDSYLAIIRDVAGQMR